ncbi:MAG TPA: DUF5110 domain-containing protein, partial [Polyangia bacterium]
DHHPDRLELRVVVPDEDGEFTSCLHEDDGLTDAHLSGAFLRTTFCLARQGDRARVTAKVTGNGYPEFRRRLFRLTFLGCRPDKLALGRGELRVSDGGLEFDNRGEDFELTFATATGPSPLASIAAR